MAKNTKGGFRGNNYDERDYYQKDSTKKKKDRSGKGRTNRFSRDDEPSFDTSELSRYQDRDFFREKNL